MPASLTAQETRQYLVWDKDAIEETQDLVTTQLFEAAEGKGESEHSGKSKKKSSKKKKNRKSSSSSQSSESDSDSESSSASSASAPESEAGGCAGCLLPVTKNQVTGHGLWMILN